MQCDRSSGAIRDARKAGGWYLTDAELLEALEEAYASALDSASLEVFGGTSTAEELGTMVEREAIIGLAFEKLRTVGG